MVNKASMDNPESDEYVSLALEPSRKSQVVSTFVRYVTIVVIAVAIGFGFVYARNSGEFTRPSAAAAAVGVPMSGSSASESQTGPHVYREPGVYIGKNGTFISTDGEHFQRTNGVLPAGSSLPTFTKTNDGRFERSH